MAPRFFMFVSIIYMVYTNLIFAALYVASKVLHFHIAPCFKRKKIVSRFKTKRHGCLRKNSYFCRRIFPECLSNLVKNKNV